MKKCTWVIFGKGPEALYHSGCCCGANKLYTIKQMKELSYCPYCGGRVTNNIDNDEFHKNILTKWWRRNNTYAWLKVTGYGMDMEKKREAYYLYDEWLKKEEFEKFEMCDLPLEEKD